MSMIEIRDPSGNLLARADDLSGAIRQLVGLTVDLSKIVRRLHRQIGETADAIKLLHPDTTNVAPMHILGYVDGWKACRDAAAAEVSDLLNR